MYALFFCVCVFLSLFYLCISEFDFLHLIAYLLFYKWLKHTLQNLIYCRFQYLQEVGDDLSVCVMNILPKVSSLPSLSAINLMKMEI